MAIRRRYFDTDYKQPTVHRMMDRTNMNVSLCEVGETTYLCLSYVRAVDAGHR